MEDKEKALVDQITKTIEDKVKGLISKEEMTAAIAEALKGVKFDITEDPKFKELTDSIKAQGVEITAIKEKPNKEATYKSVRDQIKEQLTANKEEWDAFCSGKQKGFNFEVKVAGNMLVSTNISGSNLPVAQIDPGLYPVALQQPLITPLCNYGAATSPTIQYADMSNRDGAAAAVNDSTISPLVDFDITVSTSTAADYTATSKVHANMLSDIDFMATEIERNLRYSVDIVVDNAVLTYLTGTAASAFNLTTLKVKTPNIFDAIMAAATQVVGLFHTPNLAVLNPIDYANMVGSKSTTGEYVMPPFSAPNGTTVFGLRVVQSAQVTAGYVLVGDFNKANVREIGSMAVSAGWENQDFRYRLTTFLGVRRVHVYVPVNNRTAFVYDAIQDIKDAITEA